MKEFEDKVAVVTGGSSGIGRATAIAFAREGAKVVVADIEAEGGEATVKAINDAGGVAIFVRTDVSRSGDVQALIAKTLATYGRLDYALNNAGIDGAQAPLPQYPEEDWQRIIAINLTAVYLCMKFEIPVMQQQGHGAIVNTASIGGLIGTADISGYCAAKFGVVGLTKTAALECATKGIRVNALCPGWVDTGMTVKEAKAANMALEEFRAMAGGMVPMKRMGTPEDMANAVLWLCSDRASYVSGHALVVDGALTAGLSFV
jgi:NAD(P)-dependent dehydrogenase (short-subunit alcohol dehydrogenase family)